MRSIEYREVSERKTYRIPLFLLRVTRSTFLEPLAEPQGRRNPSEGGPEAHSEARDAWTSEAEAERTI